MNSTPELTEEQIQANIQAWNEEGEQNFHNRPTFFVEIDQLTIESKVLSRYLAAVKEAGFPKMDFAISDALENAYGIGYNMKTRTILAMIYDLEKHLQEKGVDAITPWYGAVIFQIDRGGGFEEPEIDFIINEDVARKLAKRAQNVSRMASGTKGSTLPKPYWVTDISIPALDITQPEHLRPGQLFSENRETSEAYKFGGSIGKSFSLQELAPHEREIDTYFENVTAELKQFVHE